MNLEVPVQQLPAKIVESLSPLTKPSEATEETHAVAEKKLKAYEQALGITPKETDAFGTRVATVKTEAEQVCKQALPAPRTEEQMSSMTTVHCREQVAKLETAIEKAEQLQGILNEEFPVNVKAALPEPTPTGTYAELPDSREGFGPHRAYLFSVAPSNGTVMDELKELLGEQAAQQLADEWGDKCDLNRRFEGGQVSLFLDSNNKARNRQFAETGAKTTQEEDFQATQHGFADDLAATLICARIYKKVMDKVPLSDGEQELYQKLMEGVLRSCSGALDIGDYGRLRANYFFVDGRFSISWALGSPLSPESKAA
jgi:hypothetical protein